MNFFTCNGKVFIVDNIFMVSSKVSENYDVEFIDLKFKRKKNGYCFEIYSSAKEFISLTFDSLKEAEEAHKCLFEIMGYI